MLEVYLNLIAHKFKVDLTLKAIKTKDQRQDAKGLLSVRRPKEVKEVTVLIPH